MVLTTRQGYYREALRLQQLMQYTNHVAEALEGLAGIAARTGDIGRAVCLLAAAHGHREATAWPRWRDQAADYSHDVAFARAQLDPVTWQEHWERGCAMTLAQAVALALAE